VPDWGWPWSWRCVARCLVVTAVEVSIVVGSATLGGSIELVRNAAQIAELAIEKRAQTILMPVSARRQLNDLADDMWTKVNIEFYRDVPDAVFKALEE
jgi:ATP-dependent Lon protease